MIDQLTGTPNTMDTARQLDTPLPPDVVELVDAEGAVKRLEGENLLVACAGHYSGMKPIKIGEPVYPSLLSGQPGYLVRIENVEVPLTLDEFIHLALNALNPTQHNQLREACGEIALIDSRFYDPESGKALQPKVRVSN